jgi:hypothetical protein
VPTLADGGCRVVSATDPHGRNLGFLVLLLNIIFVLIEVTGILGVPEYESVLNAKKDNQGVNFTGEDTILRVTPNKCHDISKQLYCCYKSIALSRNDEDINTYFEKCQKTPPTAKRIQLWHLRPTGLQQVSWTQYHDFPERNFSYN